MRTTARVLRALTRTQMLVVRAVCYSFMLRLVGYVDPLARASADMGAVTPVAPGLAGGRRVARHVTT